MICCIYKVRRDFLTFKLHSTVFLEKVIVTAQVFRSDSPGKVAQWLARSIRES
jgi:hypothetical protein